MDFARDREMLRLEEEKRQHALEAVSKSHTYYYSFSYTFGEKSQLLLLRKRKHTNRSYSYLFFTSTPSHLQAERLDSRMQELKSRVSSARYPFALGGYGQAMPAHLRQWSHPAGAGADEQGPVL